ncbi:MAG: hypothetical protein R3C30_01945 [Hyphomonadaceae bacterium]
MILRRIIEHVKAQNWTAVAIDFFIVVFGVFIGIQVSNWNEARAQRAELNQQLISFRIELQENRAHFAQYRAELVEQMDDVLVLRSAFRSATPALADDEINARLLNIQRIKTFAPELTALDELRDTGGLRRLSGEDIRAAISVWERSLANVNRNYADGLRQRDNVMNPYMMEHIAYGPLLEQSYIVGEGVGVSEFQNDYRALAGSRELDNQLAYRYGITGSTVFSLDELDQETSQLIDALGEWEAQR